MGREVAIGIQNFSELIENNCFYVDKTHFIKEWWESRDSVTLITRPRRFGKTLNMSMVEQFFSVEYAGRGDLFEGLKIWQEEEYRMLQGTYPVISLSFSRVKEKNYATTKDKIYEILRNLYINKHATSCLLDNEIYFEREQDRWMIIMKKGSVVELWHNNYIKNLAGERYCSDYYHKECECDLEEALIMISRYDYSKHKR